MEERLQKIISRAGIASRRAAEKMIQEGRVSLNGRIVTESGTKADTAHDEILVDGKAVQAAEEHVYFLLNKPKGYLSTAKDERGRKTVLDLLSEVEQRIYPVGRLDNNTEGLLLLTNDGELMNGLLHPSREIYKTYIARVSGEVTEEKLRVLREGVQLEDGLTAPAKARILEQELRGGLTRVEVIIHEGRNRQVRRMFAAIGCDVKALKRTEFAGLNLSGVHRGAHRRLTPEELAYLREVIGNQVNA